MKMYEVKCNGCGRLRYWDDEKDYTKDSCPECGSNELTFTIVEVTE